MSSENAITALLGGSIILLVILLIVSLAFIILYVVSLWKLFKKAGKNGWEAIIPFYNTYVLVEIAGLNWWYFLIAISGTIIGFLGIDGLSTVTRIASYVVNFFIFYNLAKKMKKTPVSFGILGALFSGILVVIIGLSKTYEYDSSVSVSPNGPIGEPKEGSSSSEPERYCLGCGQKLKPNTQFCENCGKKVD